MKDVVRDFSKNAAKCSLRCVRYVFEGNEQLVLPCVFVYVCLKYLIRLKRMNSEKVVLIQILVSNKEEEAMWAITTLK